MLWVKALHIFFVASWFAGLFYLPRIFVNMAMETDQAANARLLTMSRKLYRFMFMLEVPALAFGLVLWLYYGIGKVGPGNGWLHAKLAIVVLLVIYQHWCGALLKAFEKGANKKSHVWFRWFNELPTIALLLVVIFVVVKPF